MSSYIPADKSVNKNSTVSFVSFSFNKLKMYDLECFMPSYCLVCSRRLTPFTFEKTSEATLYSRKKLALVTNHLNCLSQKVIL